MNFKDRIEMIKVIEAPKEMRFVTLCIDKVEKAFDGLATVNAIHNEGEQKEELRFVKELLNEWKKEPISSNVFATAYHAKNNCLNNIGYVLTGYDTYHNLRFIIRSHLEISLSQLIEHRQHLKCFLWEMKMFNEELSDKK